ncbi:hypothetical protein DI392_07150 [Vibrio albus]|uniref:HypC/HybG/HupF family hydrogenase formation chaperone n=1 Tax=Vibrio albus TaxID=2200953 RepID=A0A2U3BB05_9VIBR|nr:HypC/HybG/HupF family hydrogenase formation chaperone [Vibrio albus]PWI33968.1 hypothetical protein DI392_07150 [Vibrio albus]
MCLGIPGKVIEITDADGLMGTVDIGGVRREINLACVTETRPEALLNRWVLIHVGFALCVIDEEQARATLDTLEAMQDLEQQGAKV